MVAATNPSHTGPKIHGHGMGVTSTDVAVK